MTEKAIFAAGCFWHVQETYAHTKGVLSATAGYTGGSYKNPGYEDVSSGRTGHAESVMIEYDPTMITYEQLLDIFWGMHDPTTLDRQGPDRGSQYRSAIFFTTEDQRLKAEVSKDKLQNSGRFGRRRIVTEIIQATEFYRAEEYHQNYLEKKGLASCGI